MFLDKLSRLPEHVQKYAAEFAGTFILIFLGTGSAVVDEVSNGAVTQLGISVVFGVLVFGLICAFAYLSGAHINPAVTLAFALNKHFPWKQVLPYFSSQATGALLASWCLKQLFPSSIYLGGTLPSGSAAQSFWLEFALTFTLLIVVLQAGKIWHGQTFLPAIIIGGYVLLAAYFASPICGASMNPARSFGPALISQQLHYLWIYLIAPFLGAVAAVVFFKTINQKKMTKKKLLFVCVENSNRSQMSQAFAKIIGGQNVEAYSAGSKPSGIVNPKAIEAMQELGYDLSSHDSKSLEEVKAFAPFDAVVTMGCGDACPWMPALQFIDWQIPDPKHMEPAEFNEVRDFIKGKVNELIEGLQ